MRPSELNSSQNFYQQAPPDRGASSFVYPPSNANLSFFVEALHAGCLVAIPTETVYGLAARALDPVACRAIFSVKGRPLLDPLIVHCFDLAQAAELAELPTGIDALAAAFWPGPLTLILRKHACVPDLVTAGLDTVAIRIPGHPVARQLIERCGFPLAAPSANPFGYISPTRASHVSDSFGAKVPFIIDGGPCQIGVESTILDLSTTTHPRILRPGHIGAHAIAAVIGTMPSLQLRHQSAQETTPVAAPGSLARHYSPRTALTLHPCGALPAPQPQQARLFLQRPQAPAQNDFWFSEDGTAATINAALFAMLRQLDALSFRTIHCECPPPDNPRFLAITDRLQRAACRSSS